MKQPLLPDTAITVIVPTYQRLPVLSRCLGALARQQLPTGVRFDVLVVSDCPDPAVAALIDRFNREKRLTVWCLQQAQRRGPAAARNRGWQATDSPFIAFTDDDCLPEPGWLATGLAGLQAGAPVLTGRVVMPLPDQPTHHDRTTALLETAEFVTANLFCRRDVLAQVGGFDEQFDSAWREDSDLHFKLLEAGIPIQSCPDAVIVHPLRPAPWYASMRDERKNRYDALLYRRHPQLFRQRIPTYKPLVTRYYASVISAVLGLLALLTNRPTLATGCLFVWLALTGWLVYDRLSARSVRWQTLFQSVLTSLATPFLSVYWRLHGAYTYRTWYW